MPIGVHFCLPAERRVKRRRDFLHISKSGRLIKSPHFLVFVLKQTEGPSRLGVTVTRKIGGAVVRNRIKRYLREFFRLEYLTLPLSTDISIIAKRGADKLNYHDTQQELQTLFTASRRPVGR